MGIESVASALLKPLVRRALEIEDQQLVLVTRIDQKLDVLLGAHYSDGVEHLRIARQPGIRPEEARGEMIKARDAFIHAHSRLGSDPYKQSLAAINLVAIHLVLDAHPAEAQRRAEEAHQEAIDAVARRCQEINHSVGRKTLTGDDRRSKNVRNAVGYVVSGAVIALMVVLVNPWFAVSVGPGSVITAGLLTLCVLALVVTGLERVEEQMGTAAEWVGLRMRGKELARLEGLHSYVNDVADLRRKVDSSALVPDYEIVNARGGGPLEYRAVSLGGRIAR